MERFKESKPHTRAEMCAYMCRIGLTEGMDFYEIIMENGWADSEEEVREYLESLDVYPWDD